MKYINREVSWLSFNERVLQEAENQEVPLIERLRFLGIYANNLDEFYRVRYATVRRAVIMGAEDEYHNIVKNQSPEALLKQINTITAQLGEKFENIYSDIFKSLEQENIFLVDEKTILEEHKPFLNKFFKEKLAYTFDVFILNKEAEFPELRDDRLYLAVKINKKTSIRYALIQMPTDKFNRWVVLPEVEGKKYIIFLEDVIRIYLPYIFSTLDEVKHIEAHAIRITRDAKLSIDNDLRRSFIEKMESSVKHRRKGDPVRMVYDAAIGFDTLEFLRLQMGLDNYDNFSIGRKYLNRRDLMKFPNIGGDALEYPNIVNDRKYLKLHEGENYFEAIEKKDFMIFAPYDDYTTLIRFLRFAAIDPKVKVIKLTVYRVADHSEIMNALMNAAQNGKKVEVCVELQARFDETQNMLLSQKLMDLGVNVRYGVRGLKVHAKIGYIERETEHGKKCYAIVSTGNFHEGTANVYTDYTLLTAHKKITFEVGKVFKFFDQNFNFYDFKHLIVSPKLLRSKLYKMIEQEIENARMGREAAINIKVNSLCDEGIIDKLYKASKAGVKVRLIVRGICSIICGKEGLSENIEGISVVDKFLEHTRIYWFHAGGKNKVFISSADLMTRNIDYRVEVTCPIKDQEIKQKMMETFDLFFKDNTKARILNEKLDNQFVKNDNPPVRAQFELARK